MTRLILRFFAPLALALLTAPAMGATFYVATNGNDGNPGSQAQPWRTLQYAANRIEGGDVVVVRGGSYAGASFGASASGSPGHPTVLKAWPGETPRITSDGGQGAGLNLEGVSWMVVDGFVANDRVKTGIRVVGGAQWGLACAHVTVRNNRLDNNGRWGIFTAFCDDLVIEYNETSRSVAEHGIYVSNSGDRPQVRGNLVWGNRGNGIHLNGDISEGGDGIISGAVIEGNVIQGNGRGGGSAINMDGVQNAMVRNNLLVDNHASGISLYRIDGGGPSTGNRVLNNTIVMASDGRWALNIQDGARDNTVYNNILWNRHPYRGSIDISADSLPGFVADHNAVMERFTINGDTTIDLAAWQALGYGAHAFVAPPATLFADVAGDDYSLAAGSPAIDAGKTLADVPVDITGAARPVGAGFDIGAYEYRVGGTESIFRSGFE